MIDFIRRLLGRPLYPELRKVIVNLKSGTSIKGVVWARKSPFVVVRNPTLLSDRGQAMTSPTVVDGELAVLESDIDFVQVM